MMEKLKGIPASPGIYIGKAFLYQEQRIDIPMYSVKADEIENELQRLDNAFEVAQVELENLKIINSSVLSNGENLLVDTHILMLSDPEFQNNIKNYLMQNFVNAESAVYSTTKEFIGELSLSNNTYAKERASDFRDVARRVLGMLTSQRLRNLSELAEECVVTAKDILPSDAIIMDKKKVHGIVLEAGGRTSHTAIIARAFGIPAVLGVAGVLQKVKTGHPIIVDGDTGTIIIDPDSKTLDEYRHYIEKNQEITDSLKRYTKKVAETDDGKRVILKANIEILNEVENVKAQGAEGIGLFRSEFLLMQNEYQQSEKKQFEVYKALLENFPGQPVTIRTLDIGGDKIFADLGDHNEKNPLLGWRGIRFSLSVQDIFRRQLRALFRASVYGDLKIMFPMISSMEELDSVLDIISQVKNELSVAGISFSPDVKIGMMVEVPSAVLEADNMAKKVDFFSIGTNDLIQYSIAVDRGNEKVAYLYQPFNPAIIRLLKMTADAAHRNNITVSVCGEAAADPLMAILLLGMGIDELSMSSQSISVIKKIIRNVTYDEAKATLSAVCEMKRGSEINNYLRTKYNDRFGIYFQ